MIDISCNVVPLAEVGPTLHGRANGRKICELNVASITGIL